MSDRIYMNNDWKFAAEFTEDMILETCDEHTEKQMEEVRIPHTCKETPYNYFDEKEYQMICGYRKIFYVPKQWETKAILLTFEGIAHDSEIFINGKKAGEHHCGYTSATFDISGYLKWGQDNLLAVKVNSREDVNIPPFGNVIDYMTYGGIYREVYLEVKNPDYLQDVYVVPELDRGSVILYYQIKGEGQEIQVSIKHQKQEIYPYGRMFSIDESEGELVFPVEDIDLWQLDNPILYDVKVTLYKDGKPVDEKIVRTGFRRVRFQEDGFYLNGKKLKIRGLNRHQSYPYVGYAMPESMQKMDADILKNELGLNAVRTSHYPQSHHFLDRCDEIGLLVFTEIPGWQYIGDEKWKAQARQNTADMIRQYRNHTSVILWGVRINESPDDDILYGETNQIAHKLDPYRLTGGVRNLKKSHFLEDVYTYNDFVHSGKNRGCEKKKSIITDVHKPYMITEYNGHMYPTKSFDCEEHRLEHALRHARVLNAVAGEYDICGSFGWCMADYNTHKDFGSGDRICYHGVLDMFRNHKLAAEVYASQQEEEPVLAVSSGMDIGELPESKFGNVYLFTNADSVRMYKNDHFVAEYKKENSAFSNLKHGPLLVDDYLGDFLEKEESLDPKAMSTVKKVLNATARYGADHLPKSMYPAVLKLMVIHKMNYGQLSALYGKYIGNWGDSAMSWRFEAIKDGKVVKTVTRQPVKEVHLEAEADHTLLQEKNTYDVAAVRIRAVDENGNVLPFYQEPVRISLEGPAKLIGPDVISLKGGMGGTYLKTTGESGSIKVIFSSPQTENAALTFQAEVILS